MIEKYRCVEKKVRTGQKKLQINFLELIFFIKQLSHFCKVVGFAFIQCHTTHMNLDGGSCRPVLEKVSKIVSKINFFKVLLQCCQRLRCLLPHKNFKSCYDDSVTQLSIFAIFWSLIFLKFFLIFFDNYSIVSQ